MEIQQKTVVYSQGHNHKKCPSCGFKDFLDHTGYCSHCNRNTVGGVRVSSIKAALDQQFLEGWIYQDMFTVANEMLLVFRRGSKD